MRQAARRDANEPEIVAALRKAGASVTPLSMPGVPDLLVGHQGESILIEVKNDRNGLTEEQETWHQQWQGRRVWIVRTVEEALTAIGAI